MQNNNLDNYSNEQQYNGTSDQQYDQTDNQHYYASDNQQYTSQGDQPDDGNGTRKALVIACCTVGILAAVLILLILGIMITNSGSKKVEEEVKEKVKEKVEEEIEEELEDLEDDVEDKIQDKIEDVNEETVDQAKEKAKGLAEDAKEAAEDENEKHRYDSGMREEREPERPAQEEERARETRPSDDNAAAAGVAEEEKPATSEQKDYVWRGDSSRDFTVTLMDGSKFTLSKQAGKVVLLNFWTTWCGPCCREMPAFQWLYDEYDSDEVVILAMNFGEDAATVDSFILRNGYTFPVGYDTDGTVGSQYLGGSIPYTAVFNKDGTIYQDFVGASTAQAQYEEYKKAIDGALANQ